MRIQPCKQPQIPDLKQKAECVKKAIHHITTVLYKIFNFGVHYQSGFFRYYICALVKDMQLRANIHPRTAQHHCGAAATSAQGTWDKADTKSALSPAPEEGPSRLCPCEMPPRPCAPEPWLRHAPKCTTMGKHACTGDFCYLSASDQKHFVIFPALIQGNAQIESKALLQVSSPLQAGSASLPNLIINRRGTTFTLLRMVC